MVTNEPIDVEPRLPKRPRSGARRTVSLLVAVATLMLTTSGVAAQADVPVLDFAEIQVGEVRIVTDPSGTFATIEVSTSIDAACAVVLGEDETFGRLATDLDMAGGGHRDHRVLLSGLRPETTYAFRLQGSGADGSLYRSRLYSFRTPAPTTSPSASASASDNLAIGARIVEVSSEFSASFGAANAVDGEPSTEWSSLGDGDEAFITLDLGRTVDVTAVAFGTRQMSDGSAITQTFTVTADGQVFGPFLAGTARVAVEITAQTLRFDVEASTGGNTGAVEIEVYGSERPTP